MQNGRTSRFASEPFSRGHKGTSKVELAVAEAAFYRLERPRRRLYLHGALPAAGQTYADEAIS